jgi:hypothetical protein
MINKNNIYLIISILILMISLWVQRCGDGKQPSSTIIEKRIIDTVYTEVIKEVPTYIPQWNTIIKYVHDTTKIIDTTYVIGNYYSTYVYNDSLINDTLCLYINDSVSENKIKTRDIKYTISFPTITITDIIIQNKNEYYVGFGLIGNKTSINYFGPELLLRTKKKNVYGIGVGIDGNITPNISLKTYWKIGKK